MSKQRTDYESVVNQIASVGFEISTAQDTRDFDDVLEICRSLLNLIDDLNERDATQ